MSGQSNFHWHCVSAIYPFQAIQPDAAAAVAEVSALTGVQATRYHTALSGEPIQDIIIKSFLLRSARGRYAVSEMDRYRGIVNADTGR